MVQAACVAAPLKITLTQPTPGGVKKLKVYFGIFKTLMKRVFFTPIDVSCLIVIYFNRFIGGKKCLVLSYSLGVSALIQIFKKKKKREQ